MEELKDYECPRCRSTLVGAKVPNTVAGGKFALGSTIHLDCSNCGWSWKGPAGSEPAQQRQNAQMRVHVPYNKTVL